MTFDDTLRDRALVDDRSRRAEFAVPVDHPCLAGHFPGNPLVPAVVILDFVIDLAERWLGPRFRVSGISQAKFLAPLMPTERAEVFVELEEQTLRFTVRRGDVLVSRGALVVRRKPVQ